MTGPQSALTVICATALATGCVRTVDGAISTRRPVAEAAHRAVQIGALGGLLLTQQQAVDLVGGANIALVATANSTSDASLLIDDRSCAEPGFRRCCGDLRQQRGGRRHAAGRIVSRGRRRPGVTAARASGLAGCANRPYGFHSSNDNHSYFDTGELGAVAPASNCRCVKKFSGGAVRTR
jgi:hypothetical protein